MLVPGQSGEHVTALSNLGGVEPQQLGQRPGGGGDGIHRFAVPQRRRDGTVGPAGGQPVGHGHVHASPVRGQRGGQLVVRHAGLAENRERNRFPFQERGVRKFVAVKVAGDRAPLDGDRRASVRRRQVRVQPPRPGRVFGAPVKRDQPRIPTWTVDLHDSWSHV